MKRPNRSGAVIKLGGKRRKPYAARITVGTYINSKGNVAQKYKYVGYFEKSADALACLEKYNVTGQTVTIEDGQRFSEIYDLWYAEKTEKNLSAPAMNGYRVSYKRLKPLHDMVFKNIRLSDLENAISPYKSMSTSTINQIKVVLSGMYRYAMRHDIVDKDYASLLDVTAENTNPNPHTPFTDEEVRTLWKHTDDPVVVIVLILIYTGMRVTELLEALSENYHTGFIQAGKKTAAGRNRIIPLHEDIIPLLEPSGEFLIHDEYGRPYEYNRFKRLWDRHQKKLGINHKLHDTRHTCASKMEQAGIDPYHRKLILGHAIDDVTFGVYTHVPPEVLIQDINKIKF